VNGRCERIAVMSVLGALAKEIADHVGVPVSVVERARKRAIATTGAANFDDLRWRILRERVLPDWRKA
jgi:hypothetical protein